MAITIKKVEPVGPQISLAPAPRQTISIGGNGGGNIIVPQSNYAPAYRQSAPAPQPRQDSRGLFSKLYDQVNFWDNGRTFKNATPTNDRSILGQTTHNGLTNTIGNLTVKPVVSTAVLPLYGARLGAAKLTGNQEAFKNAAPSASAYWHQSIPGFFADQAINTGKFAWGDIQAPTLDIMGKPAEAQAARERLGRAFNATVFGSLTRPVQKGVANIGKATPEEQASMGLDPNATGAQTYFADPLMGASALVAPVKWARGKGVVEPTTVTDVVNKTVTTPKDIPVGGKRTYSKKVTVNNPVARVDEIRAELNKLPNANDIASAQFNMKQNLAATLNKIKQTGYTVAQKQELTQRVMARYEANKASMQQTMEYRKQLDDEASALKQHPAYQAARPNNKPVVSTKAVDTEMVSPGVMAKSVDGIKTVRGDTELPYRETTVRPKPTKPDSLSMLNIKISRVKDPVRKAELIAEREARFPDNSIKSQTAEGINQTLAAQEKAAIESSKSSLGDRISHKIKNQLIDPWDEYAKSDRLTAKREGKPLGAERKLTKLHNDLQNSDALLRKQLKDKTATGQSVQDVMRKYPEGSSKAESFLRYVEAKVDLENRSKGGVVLNPNLSPTQLRTMITHFEKRYPSADLDARTLKSLKDTIDIESSQVGINTAADVANVSKARSYYYPSKKASPDATGQVKVSGGITGSNASSKILKERTGGGVAEHNWSAIISRFSGMKKEVLGQRVFREMEQRSQAGNIGAKVVDPKTMDTTGRNIIHGYKNGEHSALELNQTLADMSRRLGGELELGMVERGARALAGVQKAAYTGILAPTFHTVNLVKNPILYLHNVGLRALNPMLAIEGFKGALNLGKFSEHKLTPYGANEIRGITQSTSVHKIKAEIMSLDWKQPGGIAKFGIKHPYTSLKAAGNAIDHVMAVGDRPFRTMAAKVAYKRAKKAGKSESQALEAAAYEYNEAMGNFNRVTKAAREGEAILLYSGAMQAGGRAFVRSYRERPFQTLAVDALFTGVVGTIVSESMNNDTAKEFYKDMESSNKSYVLDDNIVMVTPGANKDEKTGEWKGIVLVPLSPDFRPLNRTVRKYAMGEGFHPTDLAGHATADITNSVQRIPTSNVVATTGLVLANRDPRNPKEAIASDFEIRTKNKNDITSPGYTSNTAVAIAKHTTLNPKQVDKLLDNLGLTGDALQNREGSTLKTIKNNFEKKFGVGLKGSTPGGRYYSDLQAVYSTLKDEKDYQIFAALHTKSDKRSPDTAASRAMMLLDRPDVLRAEAELNKKSVARGQASNPLYDLSSEQQQKVLRYRANKAMNSAKQNFTKDGKSLFTELGLDEQWYQNFRTVEDAFYKTIGTGDSSRADSAYSGTESPKASGELQQKLDYYYTLPKGTGARSNFLKSNQDVLDYWSKQNDFTNLERVALGLKPLDDTSASGGYQNGGYSNRYVGYRRGRGSSSGGGSGSNAAYTNPDKYRIAQPRGTFRTSKPSVASRTYAAAKVMPKKNSKPKITLKKSKV